MGMNGSNGLLDALVSNDSAKMVGIQAPQYGIRENAAENLTHGTQAFIAAHIAMTTINGLEIADIEHNKAMRPGHFHLGNERGRM
jgi:hypothetical protein